MLEVPGKVKVCSSCDKEFKGYSRNKECPNCQITARTCIVCKKSFNGRARKCQICSRVTRNCIVCGKSFTGTLRKCSACRSFFKNCIKCNREFKDNSSRKICPSCRVQQRECINCGKWITEIHTQCFKCRTPERTCLTFGCGKIYKSSYRYCSSCRIKEKSCAECGKTFRSSGHSKCNSCSLTEKGRANHSIRVREYHLKRKITSSLDEPLSWRTLWAEGLRICSLCGLVIDVLATSLKDTPTLDHITPLSKGGTHLRENAQLAHHSCNSRKQARTEVI